MAWVTPDFVQTWKSGTYVGRDTPMAVVQVQLGRWSFAWRDWDGPRVAAQIWGEGGYGPEDAQNGHWRPVWNAHSRWIDLPNLSTIKRTKDFQQNGVTVYEVVLDCQDFVEKVGALGDAYHVIAPGWLAPSRGYVPDGRRDPRWEKNEWSPADGPPLISDSVKIRGWQGYGEPESTDGHTPPIDGGTNGAWTMAGMIDDVDLDGDPNTITITARNGKLLTDQRTFRATKSVQLRDPIAFYDSLAANPVTLAARSADASSALKDNPAANLLDRPRHPYNHADPAYATTWTSRGKISERHLEWAEIRLPEGRYDSFWLAGAPAGLSAYVGIYTKQIVEYDIDTADTGDSQDSNTLVRADSQSQLDGHALESDAWVDLGGRAPGAHGGWPYVMTFTTSADPAEISLPHSFQLGRDSILRVGFTTAASHPPTGDDVQFLDGAQVSVGALFGLRRHLDKEVEQAQFILVDDASEIVKVVLRWAGYTEWDVEEAGVRLSDGTRAGQLGGIPDNLSKTSGRLVFNRSSHLVDIIAEIEKQTGFIFFIADPKDAHSDGVPTFRRDASLLRENRYIAAELTEDTMLTGLKTKVTDADRPSIVRVRGKTAARRGGGVALGGDSVRRLMAGYQPPWTGVRTGGVIRHIVIQRDEFVTYAQCLYGCLMIAMQAALAMHTATAEIPAHPLIDLDDQVSVIDEPTGTNSRMWIVKSEDTMTLGETATWKQTLEGALIDTEDLQKVIAQSMGEAPMTVATDKAPDFQEVIESINWRHVVDPHTGEVSGYANPIVRKDRQSRVRGGYISTQSGG